MKIKIATLSLITLIAVVFGLTGCGKHPSTPEEVASAWGEAIAAGDLTEANEYTTTETQMANGILITVVQEDKAGKSKGQIHEGLYNGLKNLKVTKSAVSGDTAVLHTNVKDITITLKKVDGTWLVVNM